MGQLNKRDLKGLCNGMPVGFTDRSVGINGGSLSGGLKGSRGLGRIFDQLADDTKQMVAVGVKTINQEVGQGLSQYNAKVQEFADRVPGDLG